MLRPGPCVSLAAVAAVSLAVIAASGVALVAGCKGHKPAAPPPVPVAALAAIPADATAVVGLDVERLARSRLVARAVEQMFERDPELRGRLATLAKACQLDLETQVKQVHLAIGPVDAKAARPSLVIATGAFTEANLTRCLQAAVGSGNGEVTVAQAGAHSLYKLAADGRAYYFGFGQEDTVVFGANQGWVQAALGDGAKVESSPTIGPGLATVDRKAAMWAVSTVDPELGQALAQLSKGAIGGAPLRVVGTLDPLDGVRASATFTMPSAADARGLTTYARGQLAIGNIAAQVKGLGPALSKITVDQDGAEVRFRVDLTDAEVKEVLSAIDRGRSAGQDAQPAADAGAGAPDTPATPGSNSPPASDGGPMQDAGADAR